MPNIEEARAGIMSANQSAEQGLGELEQAHASLEDAQNALRQAPRAATRPRPTRRTRSSPRP